MRFIFQRAALVSVVEGCTETTFIGEIEFEFPGYLCHTKADNLPKGEFEARLYARREDSLATVTLYLCEAVGQGVFKVKPNAEGDYGKIEFQGGPFCLDVKRQDGRTEKVVFYGDESDE